MTKYALHEAQKPELPTIDVLRGENGPVVAQFGPNTYNANTESMKGPYWNSKDLPNLTFRPATTAESLDVLASDVAGFKKRILNPRWAQLGRIARTSEGVFVNVTGNEEESALKAYLERRDEHKGIYFSRKRSVVFAPYDSFTIGVQEAQQFIEGGLARALESTAQPKAQNLSIIASREHYPKGINVWGFEPTKKGEVLHRVASVCSFRNVVGDWLSVYGDGWLGGGGCAFGVQASSEAAKPTQK